MTEYFNNIVNATDITWQTALVRLLFSFIVGTVIGIEREAHNQPAGLRTHILITIGATLAMIISIFIPQSFPSFQNGDPGRIAAQVVSGIGFLGAGAILKMGANVKGLTTAASIWIVAIIGLAIGAGMFLVSTITVLVVLFALTIMDILEKHIFKERTLKKIELLIKKRDADIGKLEEILRANDIKVVSTGYEKNINEAAGKVIFHVAVTQNLDIQKLTADFEEFPGMVSISIEMFE